eukprot:CAMPEP_0172151650 /NCGR_PEP_ID=MMETSP1050-20130122/350_1 /TAXON_ID=233186 /ORGANISM="Cryptomonas curvata, Strain CCAP979/52" /LENGTH=107 /DNA_ID=CAMNT_0012819785 /DNA_START=174 /DNA_END=497 /DNA_ORIENTATION=-
MQSLNFTGMGGPMGVYEPYDTDVCEPGGLRCVSRDNEGNYGDDVSGDILGPGTGRGPHGPPGQPRGGKNKKKGRGPLHRPPCPPAFDCNGINPKYYHQHDGIMDEYW